MKVTINFGPDGLDRGTIQYSSGIVFYSGVMSAFKQLGDLLVQEIEVVRATPSDPPAADKFSVDLEVVLRDPSNNSSRQERLRCYNLGSSFDEDTVKKAVIDLVQALFKSKAKRIIYAYNENKAQLASLDKCIAGPM
ncbi:hypothetical protein IIB50_02840 [Patescibacteria group bacterium]|nr:hypothetical protein [Patescibacteria group bacterium]